MSARSAPANLKCVRPRGLFIGTATMMCLMILTTPDTVQAGKPKPPPPVRYQVQLWTVQGAKSIEVLDTNNQLQTVGSIGVDLNDDGVIDSYHGFLSDPAVDLEFGIDLNDIVAGIPEGRHIRKASAINEVGQIAAYLASAETSNPSSDLQAAVIDMNQFPPVLHVIPDRSFTDYSAFGDINDRGDVVVSYQRADGTRGHYTCNFNNLHPAAIFDLGVSTVEGNQPCINNAGVIVGRLNSNDGYRTSLTGGFETFPGLRPIAINENGDFCGSSVTTLRSGRTSVYAFVYGTSLSVNTIANTATDLNGSLDSVVFYNWLNHRDLGNLYIRDLLDPTDPNSSLVSANLSCRTMTDRRLGTNFPALGGSTKIGGTSWGVHLIPPVPVP